MEIEQDTLARAVQAETLARVAQAELRRAQDQLSAASDEVIQLRGHCSAIEDAYLDVYNRLHFAVKSDSMEDVSQLLADMRVVIKNS